MLFSSRYPRMSVLLDGLQRGLDVVLTVASPFLTARLAQWNLLLSRVIVVPHQVVLRRANWSRALIYG